MLFKDDSLLFLDKLVLFRLDYEESNAKSLIPIQFAVFERKNFVSYLILLSITLKDQLT